MIDLKIIKHIHFTGIKGVGMTSMALYVRDKGIKVTGSDVEEVFVTDEVLSENNIDWSVGFGRKNLGDKPDLLVTTAAHGGLKNPEVEEAKKLGIAVTTYAQLLAELSEEKESVCVCGVGGKTTTSSMISHSLYYAGKNPSYIIGVAGIKPLGFGGKYNPVGKNFICEADDYVISPGVDDRPKFSLLNPKILVVTNIEHDHPDVYKNLDETKETFTQLFNKIPKSGVLIACIDNKNVLDVVKKLKVNVITYGYADDTDYQIKNLRFTEGETNFDLLIKKENQLIKNFKLQVPGKFNTQNAVASIVVGDFLNIGLEELRKAIFLYEGCRRRFEKMKEENGIIFYDDYAHHPTEIRKALRAARDWFPKRRIIAIFQPHTYSRTKALFEDFAQAFDDADIVAYMDIYASAREKNDDAVNSQLLAQKTMNLHNDVYYTKDHENTIDWIKKTVKSKDIVLTMGAGDIFHLYDQI
jgi:UDP-N-acetylmuramate--alanine ligase